MSYGQAFGSAIEGLIVIAFIAGLAISGLIFGANKIMNWNKVDVDQLIMDCEINIPRSQKCKLIAVPE